MQVPPMTIPGKKMTSSLDHGGETPHVGVAVGSGCAQKGPDVNFDAGSGVSRTRLRTYGDASPSRARKMPFILKRCKTEAVIPQTKY